MGTRREDLSEALDALETGAGLDTTIESTPAEVTRETPTEAPTVENITAAPAEPDAPVRARDEAGKFAPKPADPVVTDVQAIERPEPPKSWKAEKRAVWDKLDPETAAYIHQREKESQDGFEKYRSGVQPIIEQAQPYIEEIRQRGQQPEIVIRDLLYTQKLLATGDEATRLQTVVNIAHAVGIPLGQMLQQSAAMPQHMQQQIDPQVMAANQRARDAEYQMASQQQQQHAQILAAAQAEVENFKTSHPHVEELKVDMQRLLQTGMAVDLDSAYSKALRLNDKLFTQTQATQREAAEKQRRIDADKAAKAAKANAVSTRTATPGSLAASTGGAPKGRRAALEESFDQITASRI